MNNTDLIEAMSNLVQLDIDAIHAYDQAVKEIDDTIIRDHWFEFSFQALNGCGALAAGLVKVKQVGLIITGFTAV
jgi:hypothetical protein